MNDHATLSNWLRGIAGGIGGGILGYFGFELGVRQGFYALILPGALLGLGCGMLSGIRSTAIGIVCAAAAVLLGLFAEWRMRPFNADDSLAYFITHLHQLRWMTLLLVAFGGILGYGFGKGKARDVYPEEESGE